MVQQFRRAAKSERGERQQHRVQRHGAVGRHRLFALQSSQFGGKNGVRRRGKNTPVSATVPRGPRGSWLTITRLFQISWIRRRDFHILTSSMFTYTNDERFQVLHPEGSDDWTLQIKYVQERDNGTYECQVIPLIPWLIAIVNSWSTRAGPRKYLTLAVRDSRRFRPSVGDCYYLYHFRIVVLRCLVI